MRFAPDDHENRHDLPSPRERRGESFAAGRSWFRLPAQGLVFLVLCTLVIVLINPGDEGASDPRGKILGTHPGKIQTIACSPDGRWVASAGWDSPIVIWNMAAGQNETWLEGSAVTTFSLAFSPDGASLAAAGVDGSVRVWRSSDWSLQQTLTAHSGTVRSLAFSRDGGSLVTVGLDGVVALWNTSDWRLAKQVQGRDGSLVCVAFEPDGTGLAVLAANGALKWWDRGLAAALEIGRNSRGARRLASVMAASPDGSVLAVPHGANSITLLDPAGGEKQTTLGSAGTAVSALLYSPDGRYLAAGTVGGDVELWEVATGKHETKKPRHSGAVWGLAFTPDGRSLISGASDGTLRIWRLDPDPAIRPGAQQAVR